MNYCYNKLIIIGYPHRKLGLLLLLLVLTTKNNAFAQVVVNGGASITVTGNTVLSMDTLLNDTTANIVNSGAIKVKVIGNSGSLSGNGVYSVTATFSNNGAFSKDSSTVVYNGSSQSIPGAASGVSYFNLSLAGSGSKIFAADTTRISGAFTRTSVTADALANAATIEYNGINQTVRAISYYNLCLSNKGIKAFETGSTNIKNTLSVADSVTADAITNSSTILYSGSVPQSVKTLNYFNLSLQGLAMKTFESDTSRIAGSFTASAAYVDAYTNNTTIEFNGGGTQTIPAITYYNLASSSTGNRTLAAASINVKHNFTPGSNTYTVPVNSTLLFSATSLQTIPAFAYYNLTLNNPHTVLGGNITVAKNLTLTDYDTLNLATYSAGGATGGLLKIPAHAAMYVPANNFPTGFGSYLLTGMVNYNGSDTETIYPAPYAYLASSDTGSRILPNGDTVLVSGIFDPGTNGYIATGNTVNFNGTAVQTLPPLASSAYNNLVVSNRGRATLSGNVTVTGDVSLKNVSPFDVAGYSLTHTGTGGTFTVDSACTLYVGSSFPSNFGTYTLNGTVNFNGSGTQTIPALSYFNLTSSGTGSRILDSSATIYIRGLFSAGANSYTTTGSTVNFSGAAAQTIPAITYYNLASSSTGHRTLAAASINVKHDFTPGSNTYTVPVNSTLLFSGTSLQTIPAFAYYNLTLNNPHTVLGGNITVAKNLTLTDYDTLNLATYSAGGATGGLLKIPAHAAMYVPANNFPTGFGSYLLTGMVNYNGSDTETIYPAPYAYLASSDTGSRILPNGDTVLVSGIFDPGTNGYIATGNTVNFNGTAVQTLPPLASSAYNNLVVSNRGRATLSGNVTVTGDVSLKNVSPFDVAGYSLTHTGTGGTFTVDSACTLYVGSSFPSNFGTYTLNGTVNFNGSGTQTIPALSYFNLTSSGTGSRILDSSATIYIRGLFSAGANSYTTTGSIVNFSGAAAQSVPGLSFNDLTLSNSAPVTLSGNVIVKNNLQLNGGQVATGTHNLALTNTAATALSRTTGYINGKLTRSTAANAAYVFPTGAADGYRPVKITPSSAANNSFSVEYKNNNPGTNGYYTDSVLTGVSRVNTAYYWKILRPTGSDSASIQMTIDTASFSAGAPIPVEWNGTKWKKLTGTSDSSGYTITATNIKLFGPFNFAYVAGSRNADTTSAGFTSPAPAARIFPNPVTTDLNLLIDMPENGAVTLRIFTPTGREMTSYHGESRDGTSVLHINTQSWPAGTYVYQLLLNNKTVISDKFLKN
jgi:hypothetical protein